jgi:hypothetical protein
MKGRVSAASCLKTSPARLSTKNSHTKKSKVVFSASSPAPNQRLSCFSPECTETFAQAGLILTRIWCSTRLDWVQENAPSSILDSYIQRRQELQLTMSLN